MLCRSSCCTSLGLAPLSNASVPAVCLILWAVRRSLSRPAANKLFLAMALMLLVVMRSPRLLRLVDVNNGSVSAFVYRAVMYSLMADSTLGASFTYSAFSVRPFPCTKSTVESPTVLRSDISALATSIVRTPVVSINPTMA